MSGPKCDKAHFLHSLGWPLKMKIRAFDEGSQELLVEARRRRSFGWKHPKENLSWGDRLLSLKKKKIWKEEMGFIYHFLLFSCFSSFSMVVFLPSMN